MKESTGTSPDYGDALAHAARHTSWAATMPPELDVLVLSLGCTLTEDEQRLSTSSIVSAKQGVVEFNKATGMKALVWLVPDTLTTLHAEKR